MEDIFQKKLIAECAVTAALACGLRFLTLRVHLVVAVALQCELCAKLPPHFCLSDLSIRAPYKLLLHQMLSHAG